MSSVFVRRSARVCAMPGKFNTSLHNANASVHVLLSKVIHGHHSQADPVQKYSRTSGAYNIWLVGTLALVPRYQYMYLATSRA
jgi:hypothetical protein